tara:strand:- start:1487 stop:1912 length:426 start_codon:yes stop_codon:yes gene_type:complete
MVTLTFVNAQVNTSLEIGDIAYYVSGLNTNYESSSIITGDNSQGVSSLVLIGTVSSIQFDNNPNFNVYEGVPAQNTFTVYVEEPSSGIVPPQQNDFIFFVKNNEVQTASLKGYYSRAVFRNDSKRKAELFGVSLGVTSSSK